MKREWRSPAVSAFLSLVVPGLGQLRNGEPVKAALFWLSGVLLYSVSFAKSIDSFDDLVVCVSAIVFHKLFVVAEALVGARGADRTVSGGCGGLRICALAIFVHFVGFHAVFHIRVNPLKAYRIRSVSMWPTLGDGDVVIADRRYGGGREPRRYDLVVFRGGDGRGGFLIKRIVGLPGERIDFAGSRVLIDGRVIEEPYLDSRGNVGGFGAAPVPRGRVFAMGDNRRRSHDSRSYGPIAIRDVEGKALFVLWSRNKDRIGRGL